MPNFSAIERIVAHSESYSSRWSNKWLLAQYPDLRMTVEALIAEDDAVRFRRPATALVLLASQPAHLVGGEPSGRRG